MIVLLMILAIFLTVGIFYVLFCNADAITWIFPVAAVLLAIIIIIIGGTLLGSMVTGGMQ